MKALILGSSGMIGQAATAAIAAAHHRSIGLSRSGGEHPTDIRADRRDANMIAEIMQRERIDTVIDMAAYSLEDSKALIDTIDGSVERYVLISSCDVYCNYGRLHRKEKGAITRGPLSEDAPLRKSRYPYRGETPRVPEAPDAWMDGYDKIPVETRVQAMTSDWTILRLPMVYGPDDKQRRFSWALAAMLTEQERLEIPTAWADWVTSYGFAGNIGYAVALSASHPRAANGVFNVLDYPAVSHRQWIERFVQATGWHGEIIETDAEMPLAAATQALDLSVPLDICGARLSKATGFAPPVSLQEALSDTIADESRRIFLGARKSRGRKA